jgi:hypothetical protein
MTDQTQKALDGKEFNQLISNMLTEDYGELTLEQFCTAMDAVHQESPEFKLCIRVKVDQGQIVAYGPDGQPLQHNTLRLGAAAIEIQPWSEV